MSSITAATTKKQVIDLTKGSPLKLILSFYWPLLLTSTLQQFYLYECNKIEGVNMALRSFDVLLALSRYMTYTPDEKGYYLSEYGSWKHDRFIECRMSQELFADVLKHNVIHMLDNAKAGDFDSRRSFEAYEGFMLADEEERERETRLAEPSEYDSTDSSNESDNT